MPVLKHAKKKLRQDKKRTTANKRTRSTYKELVKKAKEAPSADALSKAFKAIDKAAKANLIHDNKAGRLKSALSKAVAGDKKASTPKSTPAKKVTPKAATKKAPARNASQRDAGGSTKKSSAKAKK